MITHPFPLLRQFQDLIDLRFLVREDNVSSDEDIARLTGQNTLASLRQVHGNTAVRVKAPSLRTEHADALATDTQNLTLTIRFADCQNAIILHPQQRVVCLVHAGWRGVQASVMTSAYGLLRREWNIDAQDTFVGLGPSLCTACSDFTDPHSEVPELRNFIHGRSIDLRAALDHELTNLGVLQGNIDRLDACTRCHPETYFTYRGGDRNAVEQGFINCLAVTLVGE